MKPEEQPDIDSKLAQDLTHGVIKSFFAKGHLTESDLNLPNKDFYKKFLGVFKRSKIAFLIDHREDILNQAELFFKNKNYDYAKIFYAMYFEHTLNSFIEQECQKRKISEKVQTEIIRGIDIHGKLTWLPVLLGLKRLNEGYIGIIKKLADDRNGFIHYKWKAQPDDLDNWPPNSRIEDEFKKIRRAVKYMKQHESKILFRKSKRKLNTKLKSK